MRCLNSNQNGRIDELSDTGGKIARRSSLWRLRRWHLRKHGVKRRKRSISYVIAELNRLTITLKTPGETRELASKIYREALSKRLTWGRSTETTIAALMFLACRLTNKPRKAERIAKLLGIEVRLLFRSYRSLTKQLKIKPPIPDVFKRLSILSDKLSVENEIRHAAVGILKKAKDKDLIAGRDPWGMAAAALYLASLIKNKRITQRAVADAAGVTEVTIRNRYKELRGRLDLP